MPVNLPEPVKGQSGQSHDVERHWSEMARRKRLYSALGLGMLVLAVIASLRFANETNAGKFLDRLPFFFDFFRDLVPRDGWEIMRALFDRPSPYDNGSFEYNYPDGRHYIGTSFYIPEYLFKMVETLNIALFSTVIAAVVALGLSFLAARNMMPNPWIRNSVRRLLEILRAFPEVVVAGFFLAILSLGPLPAIAAVALHTVGALGKLFYEVIENADMKADEGLRATGARWIERVRFGVLPQILPNIMSYVLLRLEINVRASTIIGAVGGGGIGELLRLSISQNHEAKTLAIVFLLLLTIIGVDQLSASLRRRLSDERAFQPV